MTNLNEYCVQIDDAIVVLRRHIQGMDVYNSMMKLGALADLIERHRQLVTNELEGLRGDVKDLTQEADILRHQVKQGNKALDRLTVERDEWKNDHDRVAKERHQLDKGFDDLRRTNGALARNVDAAREAAINLATERDGWKKDAATSEAKLEAAIEAHERTKSNLGSVVAELAAVRTQHDLLRDAYDNQKTLTRESCVRERDMVEELYRLRALVKETGEPVSQCGAEWHDPEFAEVDESPKQPSAPYLAFDNGEAGGDRSVVWWVCTCGKRKTLTAPKIPLWTYQDHCNCGAITSLNYED